MPITDTSVRNAKPTDKPYKLHDTDGLFVLVHPNGSRYWRLKYRFLGKEKLSALGVYPEVSLGEARERRAHARKLLATGVDPSEVKKAASGKLFSTAKPPSKLWLASGTTTSNINGRHKSSRRPCGGWKTICFSNWGADLSPISHRQNCFPWCHVIGKALQIAWRTQHDLLSTDTT